MQNIAILYDASQAVISTFDLDEVLARILAILQSYFQLKYVAILLLDPDSQQLHVRSHTGWNEASLKTLLTVNSGLIGSAAKDKQLVYAPDVFLDPRYIKTIETTRSELAVPLIVRDQVVGVLDCQSDQVNFFAPEMLDLLLLFSTQASIAIQNARLYSQEQRKAAQLEAINHIARQTTAVLDVSELLGKISNFVLQAFPVDHVAIYLKETDQLVLLEHRGRLKTMNLQAVSFSMEHSLCGRAVATQKPVLENDIGKLVGYLPVFSETRSELCIPLLSFGELMGVMCLESTQPNAFDPGDVPPLESVADICANALQNARYVQKMRHMAYVDGLTGIFNRRYFEIRIEEEIERAKRYEGSMSVIMFDIDRFKRLNDDFGHLLGDDVLRQVSAIFSQNIRKADVACRFGGEEFAIIVTETSGEDAFAVADKLRKLISQTAFPGVPRPVTVTAGVASFPENGTNRDELVKAADTALYTGKQGGRNSVIRATSILK
jgi:diguanylate cyclase (GGDEF)-like protein